MYKCSYDMGLGVKSQSNLAIAGSHRNRPKSILCEGSSCGRATERYPGGLVPSAISPTPNAITP